MNANANFGEKGRNTIKVMYNRFFDEKQNVKVDCEVGAKNSLNVGLNGIGIDVINPIDSMVDNLFDKKKKKVSKMHISNKSKLLSSILQISLIIVY